MTFLSIIAIGFILLLVIVFSRFLNAVILTSKSATIQKGAVFYYRYGTRIRTFIVNKVTTQGVLVHSSEWLIKDSEFFSFQQLSETDKDFHGIVGRMHPIVYYIFHL
jgi:hypothetical protein